MTSMSVLRRDGRVVVWGTTFNGTMGNGSSNNSGSYAGCIVMSGGDNTIDLLNGNYSTIILKKMEIFIIPVIV